MEWVDKIETMLSMIALTFTGTITLAGETSHQDPENGTKEFLKASAFFNTSIYQQEKEVRSLATLQTFPTKYCILTYCRVHQLAIMMYPT